VTRVGPSRDSSSGRASVRRALQERVAVYGHLLVFNTSSSDGRASARHGIPCPPTNLLNRAARMSRAGEPKSSPPSDCGTRADLFASRAPSRRPVELVVFAPGRDSVRSEACRARLRSGDLLVVLDEYLSRALRVRSCACWCSLEDEARGAPRYGTPERELFLGRDQGTVVRRYDEWRGLAEARPSAVIVLVRQRRLARPNSFEGSSRAFVRSRRVHRHGIASGHARVGSGRLPTRRNRRIAALPQRSRSTPVPRHRSR